MIHTPDKFSLKIGGKEIRGVEEYSLTTRGRNDITLDLRLNIKMIEEIMVGKDEVNIL